MRALRVAYVDRLKTINWVRDYRHDMGETLTSKHKHWADEVEHRIVQEGYAGRYIRFFPGARVGVIFGCRADQKVKDQVSKLLQERRAGGLPPVRVYYARRNDDRFCIDIWGTEAGRSQRQAQPAPAPA
jgi:hypothetical protein